MTEPTPLDVRTTVLGEFPDFECELVLTILDERGIYAYPAQPLKEPSHSQYPMPGMSSHGIIMVDTTRADEARRLIDEELPVHLASIADAMDEIGSEDEDA